jgi:pyruvate/2-oxoglutarate dehydrogenase complex dihydrolipoamide dehydrogenase (E3) component
METTPEEYDLVVLGSGESGKYIAWTLAKKGMRAVLVERKYIGGSCPNIACLPSKNIIHSAKVASYFWRSEEFGVTKDNIRINMSAVRDRKRKMVDGLVDMHLANFKASGAELLMGFGRFIGPKNSRGGAPCRRHAGPARRKGYYQHGFAGGDRAYSWASRGRTPYAY